MQLDAPALDAEALDRRLVADQSDDDVAGIGAWLATYDHEVAIEDSGILHAVAAHAQAEQIAGRAARLHGEVPFKIFYRQIERTGGNATEKRHHDRRCLATHE